MLTVIDPGVTLIFNFNGLLYLNEIRNELITALHYTSLFKFKGQGNLGLDLVEVSQHSLIQRMRLY